MLTLPTTCGGQPSPATGDTLLTTLKRVGIFSIKQDAGAFEIREECDRHFRATLTRDQLEALGRELIDLAQRP